MRLDFVDWRYLFQDTDLWYVIVRKVKDILSYKIREISWLAEQQLTYQEELLWVQWARVPFTEKLLFKLIDTPVSTNAALGHVTERRFTDPVRHAILLQQTEREREGEREGVGKNRKFCVWTFQ
jgi:hypothetical protein